jgi:arylsulfatase A-like enzyme/Flp pilus assembly protein TadD
VNGTRPRHLRRAALVTAMLAGAALGAWLLRGVRHPPLASPGSGAGSNVLLITIDTLRADRVGAYGNASGLTPAMDRLAGSGLRFEAAFTPVPMTLPAHASILTGLDPFAHGIRNNTAFKLGRTPTLATMLKHAGYRTGAFVGAFVLSAGFGLDRDFDVYDDRFGRADQNAGVRAAERPAERVIRPAADWILRPPPATDPASAAAGGAGRSHPWFAWVHLYDPHAPYQAPPEYRRGRSPYDAEVAYTDAMIGRGLDELRAAGQLDRTIVMVVADHGEALGEHGEAAHGLFAYDSTLRVPMILTAPGIRAGVVRTPVANVDLVPTVLELLGIAVPGGLDGRSLLGVADEGTRDPRALYFEALDANLTRGWAPLVGVMAHGWKFIDLPIPELYDLEHDPGETHNLAAREQERSRVLQARLNDLVGSRGSAPAAVRAETDAETTRQLMSLGYIGSVETTGKRTFSEADDPKNLVALNEAFYTAMTEQRDGRSASALTKLRAVVAARPDFVAARMSAAAILSSFDRRAEAIALLQSAPGAAASAATQAQLGLVFEADGNLVEAAHHLETAVRLRGDDTQTVNSLAVVYSRLRRFEDGRRLFRRVLETDPHAPAIWNNLGILEMSAGDRRAAADAFRQAVTADPGYGAAWQRLGAALAAIDVAGAVQAWQRAVSLDPLDYDTLFNLGMVLAEGPEPRDALPYLERFAAGAPHDRYSGEIARAAALIIRIERHRAGSARGRGARD